VIPQKNIVEDIKSCETYDLPDNMVGAAFTWNPDGSQHAAIFLRYNGDSNLFHFDGKTVMIEPLSPQEEYYHKKLEFLDPILLPAFFAQCELILENAQPKFGYFYDGALYDTQGKFISPNDSPEYMTCVGFCLNVINGFLSDHEFFSHGDWNDQSLNDRKEFVERFFKLAKEANPEVDINAFKTSLRRIMPVEYLSGAFSKTLPVRKAFVDEISSEVQELLEAKKVA
jgi:hypothetical protein